MALIHVGNLLEIRHWIVDDADENDEGRWETQNYFQNSNTTDEVIYEGQTYKFLSFIYQGAIRTKTGDNLEAALALAANQISMDYAYDIVNLGYNSSQHHIKRQVIVTTALFNDNHTRVQKVINREYWIASSMNYDQVTVEVTLSSAVDAVFSGLPNMYLTEANVGRLPTTARVRTS